MFNWSFCNLIGHNRFSVILHKSLMLYRQTRPSPRFTERVWLRQTTRVTRAHAREIIVRGRFRRHHVATEHYTSPCSVEYASNVAKQFATRALLDKPYTLSNSPRVSYFLSLRWEVVYSLSAGGIEKDQNPLPQKVAHSWTVG